MLGALTEFTTDPWLSTLAAIERFSLPPGASNHPAVPISRSRKPPRTAASPASRSAISIRVIERLPNSFVTLSWHDATLCNYEEQLWGATPAPRHGRCPMSGARIRKGTLVYMPRLTRKVPPLNVHAMILAEVLDGVLRSRGTDALDMTDVATDVANQVEGANDETLPA
ncbi:DUF3331 domain-containing protein [Pandoraea sp. PE-S2T-3]|uniref:DUF3331 domain-containing protein n=1 Tax=Pandoraea sp. PE-S2T-3 TaxID=1986993 RepID=UPI000B3FDA46|nr:DUF3331 domain-containing protein [Pandoraea sp. PE-S2T-3]